MIKGSEINELLVSLSGLRMAQLLAYRQAELSIEKEATMHQTVDLTDLKEVVKTTKKEEIGGYGCFSFCLLICSFSNSLKQSLIFKS